MFRLTNLEVLRAPADTSSEGPIETKALTIDETINLLGEDDDEDKPEVLDLEDTGKKSTKKDSSKEDSDSDTGDDAEETEGTGEEDDDDELKEIEEELEEVDEEKLELTTPVRRREILAKYPKLFKDFPYLEKSYYREQQFTELFPTIPDAKEALESKEILERFDEDLSQGNTENVLSSVKKGSPEGFNKLVDNFLPTLAKVDENAYYHVLGNVIKHTISNMIRESKVEGQEVLGNAALLLNQFVFGSTEFEAPKNLAKPVVENVEAKRLSQEKQQFYQQQFESAKTDLVTRVDNTLKATIDSHIDPKDSMSDYVKRNAVRDAKEKLENLLKRDARLQSALTKLWQNAAQNRFSKDSTEKIKSAYLSRAKSLLPAVLKSARNEALKGIGKRAKEDNETEDRPTRKGPIASGKSTTSSNSGKSSSSQNSTKGKIPPGMSNMAYIMGDD